VELPDNFSLRGGRNSRLCEPCATRSGIAGRTTRVSTSMAGAPLECAASALSISAPATSPSQTKTAPSGWSLTVRFTTIKVCARTSSVRVTASRPTAIPKRCFTCTSRKESRAFRSCEACSPTPSGMRATAVCCWCGTASARSRFITRPSPKAFFSAAS
jgi:hypothetical protein